VRPVFKNEVRVERGLSPYNGVKVVLDPPLFHSSLYDVIVRPPVLNPVITGMSTLIVVFELWGPSLKGGVGGFYGFATIYVKLELGFEYDEEAKLLNDLYFAITWSP